MLKYVDTLVTFSEFPDEVSLCINISNCPCHCPGCHSAYLAGDIGNKLTDKALTDLIDKNSGITCVGLMGGDINPSEVNRLADIIKRKSLKVGWYSGKPFISNKVDILNFDYIKVGPYIERLGGLDNIHTNQRLYSIILEDRKLSITDITHKFWKHASTRYI